jgi:polyhydroxybutyrate depolymerase
MEYRQRQLPAGLLLLGLLSWPLDGCSSSSEGGPSAGAPIGSGGKQGSGGAISSGGNNRGGGDVASGGSMASGGTVGFGGANSGGATASGGKATGGAANGGATGGEAGKGGPSAGGATAGSSMGGAANGGVAGASTGGSAIGGGGNGGGGGASGGSGGAQSKGSPGCGSSDPLETGNFTENINGTMRRWMLDVPSGYDASKPYRLIFVWHPLGGNGSAVVDGGFDGLKALSNNTTIFATADGLPGSNNEASGTGWWNAGGGDMKLVQAMLDKINAGLCIDQERIFSTGFSFGGMMSYTLPFEFDVFRAVAPCSGKVDVITHETKFTRPVPIMAFHGSSDTFVATALGKAFLDKYAVRNKCGTQTQAVSPNGCVEYQGCEATTIWCLFQGGHTTWSEEPQAIWKFFSQF